MDGHGIYTATIIHALEQLQQAPCKAAGNLPSALFEHSFESAGIYPAAQFRQAGRWQKIEADDTLVQFTKAFPDLIGSSEMKDSLVIQFHGSRLGGEDVIGPSSNSWQVSVDGQAPYRLIRFDKYCSRYRRHYFFLHEMPSGEHRVVLRPDFGALDKSALVKPAERGDTLRYHTNRMYIGTILADGPVRIVHEFALHILDMVHHNPGEALTHSRYTDPQYLRKMGYNGQVVNDFTFAHTAITYDALDKGIFPAGSPGRAWVMASAGKVRSNIARAKKAGLAVYYFTDMIVLPKTLVAKYHDQICDSLGRISFERPMTIEIHRLMLEELFGSFPDLDGLVIRTGETYLNNVPYHTGNNPITNGPESHLRLLRLLREEVCVKRHKKIFYRTWSFGGMHDDPDYYLKVVNQIEPHPGLIFSIKHTRGDYQRTYPFNPTLTLGDHRQIVEVECQREYEGKGAYPDYVMNGVIEGFEEYHLNKPEEYQVSKTHVGYQSLKDIRNHPNFAGVWSWSRGGGWVGPYIRNEFWCRLNAYVISQWAKDTRQSERQVFDNFMDHEGIRGKSRAAFRRLCLLSATAVLRGHASALPSYDSRWVWWMRDEFLSGTDEGPLKDAMDRLYKRQELDAAVAEKWEAVTIWGQMLDLSKQIYAGHLRDTRYIRTSTRYGYDLYRIIALGWQIQALGYAGEQTGSYDKARLRTLIRVYDAAWAAYRSLKKREPDCATLYRPYGFRYQAPDYRSDKGMGPAIDHYRQLLQIP